MPPTGRSAGLAGVTAIEDRDITVKVTGELVTPDRDAVIPAVPPETPVATPVAKIETVEGLELTQLTWVVISAVEPFE